MKLTPLRIALLLFCTLVFSGAGVVFFFAGVHGSQIMIILGVVLLLPNIILIKLGVPIGIPFINSASVFPILTFLVLQVVYYFALLRLIYFLKYRRRQTRLAA